MVNVQEVRHFLNDLSDEHVTDNVVRIQIRLAENIIENEKSSSATQQLIEDAILAKAGELTYIAFTTEMERSLGVLPPIVASHLSQLKEIATLMLSYVRRGSPMSTSVWSLSDSLWAEEVV